MTTPPPLARDPRLREAIDLFNRGDPFDAGELFEELFFEAVRDEVPLARALLQLAVGFVHVERRQMRAAIGRLEEALRAIDHCTEPHGVDLVALRAGVAAAIEALRSGAEPARPLLGVSGSPSTGPAG